MEILRKSSEDEMILEFLKAESTSERFSEQLAESMERQGITEKLFLTADYKNFVIVEGHQRMTAYALVPESFKDVEVTVGKCSSRELERWMQFMENNRLTKITLEPLGLKHLKTVHEYASDLENTRYMVHLPNETIEETKDFLERKEAEIGWIINKKYWRKGYAFEAANLLVDFCKKELNIHRFIAVCDTENIGSYRVMEKLGMMRVCVRDGRKNRASEELSREYQYEM